MKENEVKRGAVTFLPPGAHHILNKEMYEKWYLKIDSKYRLNLKQYKYCGPQNCPCPN